MSPKVRTGMTHLGTALGGGLAVALWAASSDVDLYAIIKQFNVVVTEVGKFAALLMPFLTTAYGIYKASTRQKILDIKVDPTVKGVVTANTPAGHELADSIPGPLVVAAGTVEAASIAAR